MTETELKDLVRQIVLEMMPGLNAAEAPVPARRALVLFTGAWLGFDESIAQLQALRAEGLHLDIIQTESARRFLDQDKVASLGPEVTQRLVSDHPMLIVPTLTANCAAKVAYGMADNLATNVIHEFLLLNRPIVAVSTAACPDNAEKQSWFPDIPQAFASVLRANLVALTSFGVTLCGVENLKRAVDGRWPKPVAAAAELGQDKPELVDFVSESSLRNMAPGSVLRVTSRAIVTNLARDEAAASGIHIQREGE